MTTYQEYDATREWALEAATSLSVARRASRALFLVAALAGLLGIVDAIASAWTILGADEGGGVSGLGFVQSDRLAPTIHVVTTALLTAALPAGLIAAAAVLLRVYTLRVETDFLPDDDDPSTEALPGPAI